MKPSSQLIVLLALVSQIATPIVAQERTADTKMSAEQQTRNKLKAVVYAIHAYVDKHRGELPPAIVPNADLPANKCLSGFVLLLPYFAEKPSYLEDAYWQKVRIPPKEAQQAAELFKSMDLKKAWDDPANLTAAKTAFNVLQVPGAKMKRTTQGYFVSHFAFVRGFGGKEDGAFPKNGKLKISDVPDGTVNTLAIGQIVSHLGPWTAAGDPTSRQLFHPASKPKTNFGSKLSQSAYFARCDGSLQFVDLARSTPVGLRALTTRSGDDAAALAGNVRTYKDIDAWKKALGVSYGR